MAAVTHRSSTASTSNTTSYASGSFTPGNGELLVCAVVATATAAAAPTLTDSLSGSWTLVATAPWNGTTNSIYLFVRTTLIGTGAAMTVTFDCTGDAATGVVIEVAGVSGMTNTGATAVLQSAVNKNGAATTPATTFASAAQTGNPTLVFLGSAANPPGVTVPTGWTQQDSTGYGSPTTGSQYVSRDNGFTGTTITWGSTSSALWGALAVELDASGGGTTNTITPGVGSLALAGFAPSLVSTIRITPGAGQLTLSGFAPSLASTIQIIPGAGQLTLAGFAPELRTIITPGAGQLTLAGFAPTLANVVQITPGTGQLTLSGFAPALVNVTVLTPPAGQLSLTGFAPSLRSIITPPAGQLTLTGFAPSFTRQMTTGTGQLTLAGFAPSLTTKITPGPGQLSLVGFAPSLQAVTQLIPGTGTMSLTGFAPTLVVSVATTRRGRGNIKFVVDDEDEQKNPLERPAPLRPAPEAQPLPDAPAAPAPRAARAPLTPLTPLVIVDQAALDEDEVEEILFILAHLL